MKIIQFLFKTSRGEQLNDFIGTMTISYQRKVLKYEWRCVHIEGAAPDVIFTHNGATFLHLKSKLLPNGELFEAFFKTLSYNHQTVLFLSSEALADSIDIIRKALGKDMERLDKPASSSIEKAVHIDDDMYECLFGAEYQENT